MSDNETIQKQAQTAVSEDPTISDPTRILVSVSKEGSLFRKEPVVTLEGRVQTPIEVKKAEEAVQRKLPDISIRNELSSQ
ncbi:MAG: hypothetical protein ACOC0O_01565 [Spirochaetota bacterium]